mmetsp:Transcript_8873/g.24576  ORF Transcript_8873/g.24576 Transcript_8873/m.24576 type:complete len:687 (+) Transcript_8873:68-2128(+)
MMYHRHHQGPWRPWEMTVLWLLVCAWATTSVMVEAHRSNTADPRRLENDTLATVSVLLRRVTDKNGVSSIQQVVLDSLQANDCDFAVVRRFQRCSGMILRVDGLGMQILMEHEMVREIEFEEEGITRGEGVVHGSDAVHDDGATNHDSHHQRHLLGTSVGLINADQRHSRGNTGAGVNIAVLDSGYDPRHLDMVGSLIHEACFLDNDNDGRLVVDNVGQCPNGSDRQFGLGAAIDDHGHGTSVTSVIASNGVIAPTGVAPDAGIIAIKILNSENRMRISTEVVSALEYLLVELLEKGTRVDLINMSIVSLHTRWTYSCDDYYIYHELLFEVLQTLRDDWNVTAFAAAGNENDFRLPWPACMSNVIAVASSDKTDTASVHTNNGLETDIFAPGRFVEVSLAHTNNSWTSSGSSLASPHAVGCAALLIQNGDATTPDDIEARLKTSDVEVSKFNLAYPRINCKVDPFAVCHPYAVLEECTFSPTKEVLIAAINNQSLGDPVSFSFEPNSNLLPGDNVITMAIQDVLGLTSSCTSVVNIACSQYPSQLPSSQPTLPPTSQPSDHPSSRPSQYPSSVPSSMPSARPSLRPSMSNSPTESSQPSANPSQSLHPTMTPLPKREFPSSEPTSSRSVTKSIFPTSSSPPSQILAQSAQGSVSRSASSAGFLTMKLTVVNLPMAFSFAAVSASLF